MLYKLTIILCGGILLAAALTLPFPLSVDDEDCEYSRLKSTYQWMDRDLYHRICIASSNHNVTVSRICAVIHAESGGYRYAKSKAGALGLMQVMPLHLPEDPDKLYDIDINLDKGTEYLAYCQTKTEDRHEVFRMYNQGTNGKRDRYRNWRYVHTICALERGAGRPLTQLLAQL